MDNSSQFEFIIQLIKHVPELKVVYDEHISDYDELLPHVFMGDCTRFVVTLFNTIQNDSAKKNQIELLKKIINIFEDGINSKDVNIQELIAVSFIENLAFSSFQLKLLERILGPGLKKELTKMKNS